MRRALTGLDRKTLRLWLALFFLALAVPTAILIKQAYSQLKWETFHRHRLLAEELSGRIDKRLVELIDAEEARAFTDYVFLVITGDPSANFLQRSPLSTYPVTTGIPGLIGYFQVDTTGTFSTPLLPQAGTSSEAYGISKTELEQRQALAVKIRDILSENRLVQRGETRGVDLNASVAGLSPPDTTVPITGRARAKSLAETVEKAGERLSINDADAPAAVQEEAHAMPGQAAFDRLNQAIKRRDGENKQNSTRTLGKVGDLKLDYRYQAAPADELQRQVPPRSLLVPQPKRSARKERSMLAEPQARLSGKAFESQPRSKPDIRIHTFESEIDPFEISLLDSGHFVLFRKVWRDGQRYIQGALIEQPSFLRGVIETSFRETGLSNMSDLIVAFQGNVLFVFSGDSAYNYLSSAEDLSGSLLYQARFSAPLSELELIFSINRLPSGAGSSVITWLTVILALVLGGGLLLMYRLGAGQIALARQQQDFVSAVSHELKTPLTSIRMYGEMLREGWAPENKKKTYYDFIFAESERLSRLISNVLQLARITRHDLQVDLKRTSAGELMDGIHSKVASHVERAGFTLNLNYDDETGRAVIRVDADYFAQIIINLVDNGIKFSDKADIKVIDISCQRLSDGKLQFNVRDYGPGVPKDQMKKIFKLFYRSENELTRETVGTGIGLALVHQLAQSMNARVDVINREPGVEFQVSFQIAEGAVK
jgi:signal transduction histidine kinase